MEIRILVVDDQALIRGALAMMLDLESGIEVVGQAADGLEALKTLENLASAAVAADSTASGAGATAATADNSATQADPPVDVILADIEMPNLDGIALTEKIHATYPNIRVLVVTTFGRPGYLRRALEAGAAGFIVKDSPTKSLVDAIRKVADGRLVIDPELAAESLAAGNDPLTDRERDALREVERGGTAAQIAERLHLSPGTVRNHLSAAIQKTGTGSRVEAARLARNNGWL